MGLLRNSLIYLGFVDDDLEEEIGGYESNSDEHSNIRKISSEPVSLVRTIQPSPTIDQVHVVEPGSYRDSVEIGDKLRESVPVIVNLKEAEDDLSKRVMGFCAGLAYGLDGKLSRLMPGVYLVTPSQVEVSTEDRRRLSTLSV